MYGKLMIEIQLAGTRAGRESLVTLELFRLLDNPAE